MFSSVNLSLFALLLITAVTGGGTAVFSKLSLSVIPPFSFLFLRFFLANLVLLPFVLREVGKIRPNEWGRLFIFSALASANIVFFVFGIRETTATVAQTLYALIPVFSAIATTVFFRKKMSIRVGSGVIVGLIGAGILIFEPSLTGVGVTGTGTLRGNALVAMGVVSFTIYSLLSKRLQSRHSPLLLTYVFVLLTLIITSVFVPPEYREFSGWEGINRWVVFGTLYAGIVGTGIFYLLYQYMIRQGGAIAASLVFYLMPVASFLWAALVLGERLTWTLVVGAGLIFAGARAVATGEQ